MKRDGTSEENVLLKMRRSRCRYIDAVVRKILAVEINRSVLPWQETKSTPTGECVVVDD